MYRITTQRGHDPPSYTLTDERMADAFGIVNRILNELEEEGYQDSGERREQELWFRYTHPHKPEVLVTLDQIGAGSEALPTKPPRTKIGNRR